jgi:hypothetical protein
VSSRSAGGFRRRAKGGIQALDAADSRTDLALRFRLDGLAPPDALHLDDFAGGPPADMPPDPG